jgi:hypothetical protein
MYNEGEADEVRQLELDSVEEARYHCSCSVSPISPGDPAISRPQCEGTVVQHR